MEEIQYETEEKPAQTSYQELPMSRVRTIMKSSPDVENISQDALYAVTAATEMFIRNLTQQIYEAKDDTKKPVEYNDLANLIASDDQYSFLDEICPRKMKGKEIRATYKKPKPPILTDSSDSEHEIDSEQSDKEDNSDKDEDSNNTDDDLQIVSS